MSNNQFSTLGNYKIDTNKTLIDKHITVESNTLENFETKLKNIINTDNEYDENELLAKPKDVNRTISKGLFPGIGKTTSACKIAKTTNTLFISPQNKLCQKIKKDGLTV